MSRRCYYPACVRPRVGSDPGWPRPRQRTIPTLVDAALRGDRGRELPVPWVARSDPDDGWMPAAYDTARSIRMKCDDLCQVCGGPRGTTVFVLAGADEHGHVALSGGALCSQRCARLTAAVCPHYRSAWPVRVYAVPHLGERHGVTSLRDLDDEADVSDPSAVLVATLGGRE